MADPLSLILEAHRLSFELANTESLDGLYRALVELGRERLDFDRLGLLLYDSETETMRGTWGTDDQGRLVDESAFSATLGGEREFLRECLSGKDFAAVWENRRLVQGDRTVGTGWNAMVVLWDGQKPFGWIAADNLLRGRPLAPGQKELLGLYGHIASSLILRRRDQAGLEKRLSEETAAIRTSEEHFRGLYEEMRRNNELKERLFTILAHDLRGPIGSIKGVIDLACDSPERFGLEDLRQLMPEIRKSITQTYGLLGNLLDWIRSQMQGIEVLRDRLPVSRPLAAACSLYAGALEAKRINLELACPDGLSVCGDERMLETILRNLVSNAIKFSPPGGRVRISAEPAPSADAVVISVADEGIGMTPELRDTLFTTNLGRGKAGTAGEKGNGLGLMFSKDLALRMGGRLEVTSALGQGSVFRLTLPDAVEGELDRAE